MPCGALDMSMEGKEGVAGGEDAPRGWVNPVTSEKGKSNSAHH